MAMYRCEECEKLVDDDYCPGEDLGGQEMHCPDCAEKVTSQTESSLRYLDKIAKRMPFEAYGICQYNNKCEWIRRGKRYQITHFEPKNNNSFPWFLGIAEQGRIFAAMPKNQDNWRLYIVPVVTEK